MNEFKKLKESIEKNRLKRFRELRENLAIMITNNGFDDGYKIVTKDDYIRYFASANASVIGSKVFEVAERHWDDKSKGYNFIIGVGEKDLMFCSVEDFNKNLEGHKKKGK